MYSTREEVKSWLKKMNVKNYVINEDLTVDVKGSVNISGEQLKEIPVKFNIIKRHFDCSNNALTNLEGCPTEVNGKFYCHDNKLTNLEGCPKKVKSNFNCRNNKLTSLEGCPKEVNGYFYCNDNELISLKSCPQKINKDFDCSFNQLTSFDYFPQKINGQSIVMDKNNIKEEELFNFNCNIENVNNIYSDFNKYGNVEEFLEKVNFYKSKRENELLKELSVNSNSLKLNKKL